MPIYVPFYSDRINPSTIFRTYPGTICRSYGAGGAGRIDWIYCFLGFRLPATLLPVCLARSWQADRPAWCARAKPRNSNRAFSGEIKPKRSIVLLPNVQVTSSLYFYNHQILKILLILSNKLKMESMLNDPA